VLNERRELLVVREWRDMGRGKLEEGVQWKLPGGLLDRGESFREGVTREVLEETGVRTRFRSVLAFWHRHGLYWGQSDLYFVARLEALSSELRLQPCEICDAKWMPLDEFVQTQDHPLILAILRRLYGLERGQGKAAQPAAAPDQASSEPRPDVARLLEEQFGSLPCAELIEEPVQWPGRDPYQTYFPLAHVAPRRR
jgi:ADP-ribose pyrophosphatase YjhB (NUDIX family)